MDGKTGGWAVETGKKLWRRQNRRSEERGNERIRREEEFGRIRKYKERAILKQPLLGKNKDKLGNRLVGFGWKIWISFFAMNLGLEKSWFRERHLVLSFLREILTDRGEKCLGKIVGR